MQINVKMITLKLPRSAFDFTLDNGLAASGNGNVITPGLICSVVICEAVSHDSCHVVLPLLNCNFTWGKPYVWGH